MRMCLKIGGSTLYDSEGQVLTDKVNRYAKRIATLVQEGHGLVVVVGGGIPAREYISAARVLGASEATCDWLGIKLARHNAELLRISLGDLAYPRIVETLDELEIATRAADVVLMGGLIPGQSTNAVAALAAEITGADLLLNATNVDGVYDKDPDIPGAKKLDQVHVSKLREILSGGGTRAGEYRLFDPVAIRIVERSEIKTVIFNGQDPDNLHRVVSGERIGTTVTHDAEQ